ncbi:MAG: alpha-amylase family glycosyl hydrolase [Chloroflexota bacterium]|nr:alpha-amylase family glycosyl hydrolase [Chloroflexota bacterium]
MTEDAATSGGNGEEARAPWWRRATIYQVYPRSFQDSDGDGTGDLEGLRARLPYLAWLGVDAIWLSPFFRSPMADFGYDVSDHCAVDPTFGTAADWDRLVETARGLGLRLILDLVANHTSDQHPWFRAARAGKRRDWYLWQAGTPERPPNNWRSVFGGSAWTWDEDAAAWYYHAYLEQQPDLNWRNPEVRDAIARVMRYWLERGADGFRIDALRQYVKDARLRENPVNPDWHPGLDPYQAVLPEFTTDRPELDDVVRRLRETADEAARADGRERVLIGELYLPIERLMRFYRAGLHLPSNFSLLTTPWEAGAIAALVERYEALLPPGAWPNWVLGNHDRPRLASRIGSRQARAAAVLLLTLRGTPTLYYGDEIGMVDVPVPAEHVRDPWERNVPGRGLGRDPARTPMQWDATKRAGFCADAATPWLPLAPEADRVHVAAQRDDPGSLLSLYRRLLALRRRHPALHSGDYETLAVGDGVIAYRRAWAREGMAVVVNLANEPREAALDGVAGEVVLDTGGSRESAAFSGRIELAAGAAVIVACPAGTDLSGRRRGESSPSCP